MLEWAAGAFVRLGLKGKITMDYQCGLYEMIEIKIDSEKAYPFPFIEVEVYCSFRSPSGKDFGAMFFHSGNNTWKCRFTPNEAGEWCYHTFAASGEEFFQTAGKLLVSEGEAKSKGMLQVNREKQWGLCFESGEETLLLGDTLYHIFGAEYCGLNVREVLEMRKKQGFNFIRARLPISPYHPGEIRNVWQTRQIWLWGGSPQCPEYESFNLEYFDAVDRVMKMLEELEMGVELILEGWMWELPFYDRKDFLPEFEELYIRYAVSRLSAYKSLYIWCPANEYNYYGHNSNRAWCWRLDHPAIQYLSGKFMLRLSKLIKDADPYKHPIGAHNLGTKDDPFKGYIRNSKEIDILLYQSWGDVSNSNTLQLARGLEEHLGKNLLGSGKVNILAEYGYEGDPASGLSKPPHDNILSGHTRRGACKALFMGVHFAAGFENTWGPHFRMQPDPKGAGHIIHLKKLFTEVIRFDEFAPRFDLLEDMPEADEDAKNLCISNKSEDTVIIYLPAGGKAVLKLPYEAIRKVCLFDTVTGEMKDTGGYEAIEGKTLVFTPEGPDDEGYRKDWVVILYK